MKSRSGPLRKEHCEGGDAEEKQVDAPFLQYRGGVRFDVAFALLCARLDSTASKIAMIHLHNFSCDYASAVNLAIESILSLLKDVARRIAK